MRKKILIGAAVFALAIVVMVSTVWGPGIQVDTASVYLGSITTELVETGYVQNVEQYSVQSTLSGTIAKINVRSGDSVVAGQVLLSIENPDLVLEKRQAELQLAQANTELSVAQQTKGSLITDLAKVTTDLQRQKSLLDAGAISQTEYDDLEAQYNSLKQKSEAQDDYINSIRNTIRQSQAISDSVSAKAGGLNIVSPIVGTVLDIPIENGEVVAPGRTLVEIGSSTGLEVKSDLLSDDLRDIKVGQNVKITAPVLADQVLLGQIVEIKPKAFIKVSALGVEQRRVPVIISLNESAALKPGYEVQVRIETATKNEILLLPRESIRQGADGNLQVLLIKDNRVLFQDINIGMRNLDQVEITEGLSLGDVVIRDGSLTMAENTKVKI